MARITVEDCLKNVDNHFDLILIAAKRARRLANGADAMIEWENDKPTVVALREIAQGLVDKSILEDVEDELANLVEQESQDPRLEASSPSIVSL